MSKNREIEVIGLNLTDELYYDAIYQAPGIAKRQRHIRLRRAGPRRLPNR